MYKTFSIGNVFGYGINTVLEHFKLYFLSFLAVIGVFFAWFVSFAFVLGIVLLITSSTTVIDVFFCDKICVATIAMLPISAFVVSTIFAILLLLIISGIIAGIIHLSFLIHDTNTGSVADIFTRFYLAPRLLGAGILYLFIVLGGLLLLIIPGLYLLARYRLFPYIIVDQEVGIIEALKISYNTTNGNVWKILGTQFLSQLISAIPLIGFFCQLFLGPLIYVEVYRKLTQQPIIPPAIPI